MVKGCSCGWVPVALLFAATSQAAGDFIYWDDNPPSDASGGDISRANLDGTSPMVLLSRLNSPSSIALDPAGGKMYWTDQGFDLSTAGDVSRANLDGSGKSKLFASSSPYSVALDVAAGKLYWSDQQASGLVSRANLDGTAKLTILHAAWASGIAVDPAGKIYYAAAPNASASSGYIGQANFDGTGSLPILSKIHVNEIALDTVHGQIYWSGSVDNEILRANLDGSGQQVLVSGLDFPTGIALDLPHGKVYWTDYQGGDISRANLDGSNIETVISGLDHPGSIALLITPRPGDANGDGRVDFADLLILAQNYGKTPGQTFSSGDFDGDGGVGFDDLLILAQNYDGITGAASPSAVPEPSLLPFLGIAAISLSRRRAAGGTRQLSAPRL
jgi:DNA-binding beta-propeller fold protein YncE